MTKLMKKKGNRFDAVEILKSCSCLTCCCACGGANAIARPKAQNTSQQNYNMKAIQN